MQKRLTVREMIITALSIALVYVFTWIIKIQLPIGAQGGLIHLGNVPFFLVSIIYGRKVGSLSGSIGMGLFDITSGWTAWAPITFITCFAMGYSVGVITDKNKSFARILLALIVALILKIAGYYIGEGIMFGNFITPLASIPGNIIQIVISAVIVMAVVKPVEKALEFTK